MREPEAKDDVITPLLRSFVNLSVDFGENLLKSITTPNFIMIEQETTK